MGKVATSPLPTPTPTRKERKKESPFLPPSRAGEKLEAGISKPLIASSSSRGMKARGRDLQNLRRGGTLMHHATKRGFKDCPGFLNSTGQNWPTCGQTGYVTPVVSGIPTAIELGGRIRIGPLVGKVAT